MIKIKIADFVGRLLLCVGVVLSYLFVGDIGDIVQQASFGRGPAIVQILWIVLVLWMFVQMMPGWMAGMAGDKSVRKNYQKPDAGYTAEQLAEDRRRMNSGAGKVMLLWLGLFALIALLYFTGLFGKSEVLLVVVAYFVGDTFCMLVWCPMQVLLMKNKCCVNCRIYGWAQFLVCGPLLLLPGVLTYSLVGISVFVLVRWEVLYQRHPERFWEGSNASLRCAKCTEKTCTGKKTVAEAVKPRTTVRNEIK